MEFYFEKFLEILGMEWFKIGDTSVSFDRLLGVVLILVLTWWISYFFERGIRQFTKSKASASMSESGVYALGRIVRYCIWIAGIVVSLHFVGINMGSLAYMGGALGVGIGFGLQNIFSNFISGIIILLEKTLKVGDFVDLQSGVMGKVAEINMRYTRITTNDNVDILVPNSEFINGRVVNWTFDNQLRRLKIPFGVAYGSNKDKVKIAGLAAAASVPFTVVDDVHKSDVWLVNLGSSSLDFELIVWIGEGGVKTPTRVHSAYMWALETELVKAGLEIPFPQQDLHMRSGSLKVQIVETDSSNK